MVGRSPNDTLQEGIEPSGGVGNDRDEAAVQSLYSRGEVSARTEPVRRDTSSSQGLLLPRTEDCKVNLQQEGCETGKEGEQIGVKPGKNTIPIGGHPPESWSPLTRHVAPTGQDECDGNPCFTGQEAWSWFALAPVRSDRPVLTSCDRQVAGKECLGESAALAACDETTLREVLVGPAISSEPLGSSEGSAWRSHAPSEASVVQAMLHDSLEVHRNLYEVRGHGIGRACCRDQLRPLAQPKGFAAQLLVGERSQVNNNVEVSVEHCLQSPSCAVNDQEPGTEGDSRQSSPSVCTPGNRYAADSIETCMSVVAQGSEIDPKQDSLSCSAEEVMGLSFKVKEDSMSIEHKLTPVALTSAKNVTASEGISSGSPGHVRARVDGESVFERCLLDEESDVGALSSYGWEMPHASNSGVIVPDCSGAVVGLCLKDAAQVQEAVHAQALPRLDPRVTDTYGWSPPSEDFSSPSSGLGPDTVLLEANGDLSRTLRFSSKVLGFSTDSRWVQGFSRGIGNTDPNHKPLGFSPNSPQVQGFPCGVANSDLSHNPFGFSPVLLQECGALRSPAQQPWYESLGFSSFSSCEGYNRQVPGAAGTQVAAQAVTASQVPRSLCAQIPIEDLSKTLTHATGPAFYQIFTEEELCDVESETGVDLCWDQPWDALTSLFPDLRPECQQPHRPSPEHQLVPPGPTPSAVGILKRPTKQRTVDDRVHHGKRVTWQVPLVGLSNSSCKLVRAQETILPWRMSVEWLWPGMASLPKPWPFSQLVSSRSFQMSMLECSCMWKCIPIQTVSAASGNVSAPPRSGYSVFLDLKMPSVTSITFSGCRAGNVSEDLQPRWGESLHPDKKCRKWYSKVAELARCIGVDKSDLECGSGKGRDHSPQVNCAQPGNVHSPQVNGAQPGNVHSPQVNGAQPGLCVRLRSTGHSQVMGIRHAGIACSSGIRCQVTGCKSP